MFQRDKRSDVFSTVIVSFFLDCALVEDEVSSMCAVTFHAPNKMGALLGGEALKAWRRSLHVFAGLVLLRFRVVCHFMLLHVHIFFQFCVSAFFFCLPVFCLLVKLVEPVIRVG